jgi:hypothetical protein
MRIAAINGLKQCALDALNATRAAWRILDFHVSMAIPSWSRSQPNKYRHHEVEAAVLAAMAANAEAASAFADAVAELGRDDANSAFCRVFEQ